MKVQFLCSQILDGESLELIFLRLSSNSYVFLFSFQGQAIHCVISSCSVKAAHTFAGSEFIVTSVENLSVIIVTYGRQAAYHDTSIESDSQGNAYRAKVFLCFFVTVENIDVRKFSCPPLAL